MRLFEPRSSPSANCKPMPREPSASFHIFLFRKRKMNGISTEKSFVCDANHRLTARWHDAACCSSSELRGPQPPAAEARYSLTLIERTTAGCRPSTFAAKRRYLRRLAPLVRPPQPPNPNFPRTPSPAARHARPDRGTHRGRQRYCPHSYDVFRKFSLYLQGQLFQCTKVR